MATETKTRTETVPIERFGKDHWSLLAYVETRCVDHKVPETEVGALDPVHMRTNEKINYHLGLGGKTPMGMSYDREYPTRIKLSVEKRAELDELIDATAKINDKEEREQERVRIRKECGWSEEVHDHDDWSCLEDLEEAGLLEILSLANYFVQLTDEGWRVAGELRKHKGQDKNYHDFAYKPLPEKTL